MNVFNKLNAYKCEWMTSMNKATFHTTDSVNLVHSNIIDGCMCERIKKKKDIYKKKTRQGQKRPMY